MFNRTFSDRESRWISLEKAKQTNRPRSDNQHTAVTPLKTAISAKMLDQAMARDHHGKVSRGKMAGTQAT